MISGGDRGPPPILLVPGAALPDEAIAFDWFAVLCSPSVECEVRSIDVHNEHATANFTCRFVDQSKGRQPAPNPAALPLAPGQQVLARLLDGEKGVLYLQRIDGGWRIHSLALSSERAVPATAAGKADGAASAPNRMALSGKIDFRDKRLASQMLAERDIECFKGLAPLELERLRDLWKTDVVIDNQPAGEVLQKLAGELGLKFVAATDQRTTAKALNEPVSLQLGGCSRLQAIDEICRRVDLLPQHMGTMLDVRTGRRRGPVTFAGPFRVAVQRVSEFPERATATVSLHVLAAGLPATVTASANADEQALEIVQASGRGRDLYHCENQPFFACRKYRPGKLRLFANELDELTDMNVPIMPASAAPAMAGMPAPEMPGPGSPGGIGMSRPPEAEPLFAQIVDMTCDIPLRYLFNDLDAVPELRGRVRLRLPSKVEMVSFAKLQPGRTETAPEVRLTFQRVEMPSSDATRLKLIFTCEAAQDRALWWTALDQSGRILRVGRTRPADIISLQVPASAAAVHFKIVSEHAESWDFVLRDLPLPQHVPHKLEPAAFPGGDGPLAVEVERINRDLPKPQVQLRFRNHCQKAIDRIDLLLCYRDKNGRELKQSRHVLTTYEPFEHRLRVQVAGHREALCYLEDAGLPAETKTIDVTVTRVGFVDGMNWARAEK